MGVGIGSNAPAHHQSIKAIDDWRQVYFSRWNAKLGDVREPLNVGRVRVKVAGNDVRRRGTNLAFVGVVLTPFASNDDEPLFSHQSTYNLFRDRSEEHTSELQSRGQ